VKELSTAFFDWQKQMRKPVAASPPLKRHRKRKPNDFSHEASPRAPRRIFLLASALATPSNIILILADDMGYGDLGCFGAKDIRTPHLDEIAAEGLKLTSFYAQPICGPSRAALMTGCYPVRIGEVENGKSGHTLPHPKEVFIAEMLRDAGYRTGIVGKWHLGMSAAAIRSRRAFSTATSRPLSMEPLATSSPEPSCPSCANPGRSCAPSRRRLTWTRSPPIARAKLGVLRASKRRALLPLPRLPHAACAACASEKFRGRSKRGLYGDTIEELDSAIGDVFAELKTLGLDDKTLVVFTSDNGPWTDKQIGDHGGSPGPFRGGKMTTWEGGWRVPASVRWPGEVRAGEASDGIVSTPSTSCPPLPPYPAQTPEAKLDGLDVTASVTTSDAASPRETFLYRNGARLTAVRHEDWKLVFARPSGGEMPYMPGFVTGHIEALPTDQLYNLRTDPGETKNLATERPAVVTLLTQLADEFRIDLGDFTGPGSCAHFFEPGSRWPKTVERSRTSNSKAAHAMKLIFILSAFLSGSLWSNLRRRAPEPHLHHGR